MDERAPAAEQGLDPRRTRALLVLIIASITAGVIAWWCMSSGVGVSPDSVIYLSAADSVIAGEGLKPVAYHYAPGIADGKKLVTFPPIYSLLLSLSGRLSADAFNGARWLHSLLFALNVLLIGIAVYLSTNRSALSILCCVLLVLSSPGFLEINMMAWSEPPFLLFILSAFVLLALNIEKPDIRLLVGSALAAGLAITTRYAGITVLPPMFLTVLLLENKDLRGRLKDCLIVLVIAVFPLVAWFLRNTMVANSAANRTLAFHPMRISDIKILVNSLLTLWVPFSDHHYLKIIASVLGAALFVSLIGLALKNNAQREKRVDANSVAQVFAAIFVATYLLFIVAYNSLAYPVVDLGIRVLLPVYVFGIILMISVVHKLGRSRAAIWWGFVVLSLALVSLNAVRAVSFAVHRHVDGSGFASREWAASKGIEYVRTLSQDRILYSNGIDAIHFLTGRQALRIPAKIDPTVGRNNAEFEQEIKVMSDELMNNRAVVIYLNKITWRSYLPSKAELESVHKLPVLMYLDDGVVYGTR